MILNRNESADVDLFQLNLMLGKRPKIISNTHLPTHKEPTDSELPIGETISNDQSEFAFRNQLNSVSSSSGPVPQPILSPTSPHSTSFVTGFSHQRWVKACPLRFNLYNPETFVLTYNMIFVFASARHEMRSITDQQNAECLRARVRN
jgi:hypothetical protein